MPRTTVVLPAIITLGALASSGLARAQPIPFRCGPDCTTPGRYVLCADGLDAQPGAGGGARLVNFLEALCVRFEPPAASFELVGFAAAFGIGDMLIALLEAFADNGVAQPGALLAETGVGIPGAPVAGFSGLFFAGGSQSAAFRLCLRQQLDDPVANLTTRPLLFDADGVQGTDFGFFPGMGWSPSSAPGDLVIRAIVQYADLAPWSPGGSCTSPDAGGVGPDAGPLADAQPGADATPGQDAVAGVDAAPAVDGGVAGDAEAAADAGPDAATAGDSGADAGTGPAPPPTISAISPKQGKNSAATDVVVSGTGFVSGLSLKIGTIAADRVQVPGATTILGVVPANIAPGKYDVLVQNPDGQTAILPEGFEVLGDGAGSLTPDACGCATTMADGPGGGWLLLAALLLLRGWARRRP